MPTITFLPLNDKKESTGTESVLDVAIQHGLPIQHACGGFCACATCQIEVVSGLENLSVMDPEEKERLEESADPALLTPHSRLACQAKVHGDVTVRIVNLDE